MAEPRSVSGCLPNDAIFTHAIVGVVLGCSQAPPNKSTEAPVLQIPDGGARFTQRQRTTQALPGSNEQLLLTIDDITRGQVMASISTDHGTIVLSTISLLPDTSVDLTLGRESYTLTLESLRNELLGEDYAVFHLAEGSLSTSDLSEAQRIELLIAFVEDLEGAMFVRNGKEYAAAEAAQHLRDKWDWNAEEIRTAEEFIRLVATRSSQTGELYLIRLPDGSERQTAQLLSEELARIDGAR